MKTIKLNCASCGAPIVVPDEADTVVCSSCHSTMMVDRGEGYVTLKIVEKLANAIKENAYVTQVELKRMQLNQLISMEEMKINSLQTEFRAAKRRMPANLTCTSEMADLLLQENDIRTHVRSLYADIAHLEPGWEESLEVIRRDRQLLEQAINYLMPYGADTSIQNRIVKLHEEARRVNARFNGLETKLLKRDLETLTYPPFQDLTLEQMEELQEKIPGDLTRLAAGEQTEVKTKLQEQLRSTLDRIKAVYPRKKVENQAGPLPSLDIREPYPEEPEKLTSMAGRVKADLEKLNAIPDSKEKTYFSKKLEMLESLLSSRAKADIPGTRAKKKKRRRRTTLIVIGGSIVFCLVAFVIYAVLSTRDSSPERKVDEVRDQLAGLISQSQSTPQQGRAGTTYQEFSADFLEVTSSVTYLRDQPDLNAASSLKVEAGDILQVVPDDSVPNQWYKVSTLDGSETGYLALDWVMPFTVSSLPGEVETQGFPTVLYSFDWSSFNSEWDESVDNDEFAYSEASYEDGWYQLDVTSNDTFIYYYSNYPLDNLPDQYRFSLTLDAVELKGDVYYGIQTNTIDGANFDALLVSQEGTVFLLRVRNGYFSILYDTEMYPNTGAALDPLGTNIFSVTRLSTSGGSLFTYQYAINGKVIVELSQSASTVNGLTMGAMMYLGEKGDHVLIRMDDFVVQQ
jgi:LSD1 subclass zinc finger protein